MSLYDRIVKETTNTYGINISLAFKMQCDEVEKLQQKLHDVSVDGKECLQCCAFFKPLKETDLFCSICCDEFMQPKK